MSQPELIIEHNAGFFSCCSVKLTKIVEFINKNKRLPATMCCKKQFHNYKINPENPNEDLNQLYFKSSSNENFNFVDYIDFHWEYQFENYKKLDFNNLNFLIDNYFSVSNYINDLITNTENTYNIQYAKTAAVYYRGNDKCTETGLASYEEFFDKCKILQNLEKDITFLVQTDEFEFRNQFIKLFPNSFYIDSIPAINQNTRICPHSVIHSESKPLFGALMLHAIKIISKCKYIVTHSGNCGMWTVLYRGNASNVCQYLTHKNYKGWIS